MNKHVFFALLLIGASGNSIAADSKDSSKMTLALYDGSQAQLLQPVALDKQTAKVAKKRVNIAADALNEKLSKQLDAKFAEDLRVTLR
ncbi:MAG: hypothetical protein ACR2PS_13055 [Pseudomonadales bacterium]